MDREFIRNRLRTYSKEQLIRLIRSQPSGVFADALVNSDLAQMPEGDMIETILNTNNVFIDGNAITDYIHQPERQYFRNYATVVKSRGFNPNYWTPRPNQIEHIERMHNGLMSPFNLARCSIDGSPPGLGKTIVGSILALRTEVAFILVVCPPRIAPKWDHSLRSMGCFNFRICSYQGVIGAGGRKKERFAKYYPNVHSTKTADNDWIKIRKVSDKVNEYDWSNLPSREQYGERAGMGGCLVIWDEVQNAKGGDTYSAQSFNACVREIQGNNSKYLRMICLSGTLMEKPEDLGYIIYAMGYSNGGALADLKNFLNKKLLPEFRAIMGAGYKDDYEEYGAYEKLIVFLRTIARAEGKFSEIPGKLPFLLYALQLIPKPEDSYMNAFINDTLVPQFENVMGDSLKPGDIAKGGFVKLLLFLKHLTTMAQFKQYAPAIEAVLAHTFENPIMFQGIEIRQEDIDMYLEVNNNIQNLFIELNEEGGKKKGILGRIQKALSQLELVKLVPNIELAKTFLLSELPGGIKGSVAISMLRNETIRNMSWRLEAIMEEDRRRKGGYEITLPDGRIVLAPPWTVNMFEQARQNLIISILKYIEDYRIVKENLKKTPGSIFPLKERFVLYTNEQLQKMSFEDVLTQFNMWYIYLDTLKFQHVAVIVGDFGTPTSADLDLESEDESQRIKESSVLKPETKEEMLDLFFTGERRILITNLASIKEGVDLHDTSVGGVHARMGIYSPGIIAAYLIQVLGRLVRDGQTSNTLRMVTYVDDFRGVKSYEARLMQKMSKKVYDLQMLHSGDVSLDIMKNIENDSDGWLKALAQEMRDEGLLKKGNNKPTALPTNLAQLSGPAPDSPSDVTIVSGAGGTVSDLGKLPKGEGLLKLFRNVYSKDGSGGGLIGAFNTRDRLPMQTNQSIRVFNLKGRPDASEIADSITKGFELIKIDPKYYMVLNETDLNGPAVVISNIGFNIAGYDRDEMIMENVNKATGIQVIKSDGLIPSSLVFSPQVTVPVITFTYDTNFSAIVNPYYPLVQFLTEVGIGKPYGMVSLETVPGQPGFAKIRVDKPANIDVIYYAIRATALIAYPHIFKSVVQSDPNKVFGSMDHSNWIWTKEENNEFMIIMNAPNVGVIVPIFNSINAWKEDLMTNKFFTATKQVAEGKLGLVVAPKYVNSVKLILGVN